MFTPTRTSFGFSHEFSGLYKEDAQLAEMERWGVECDRLLAAKKHSRPFRVLVYMNVVLFGKAKTHLARIQRHFLDNGMDRSAVIFSGTLMSRKQLTDMAAESAIARGERLFSADDPECEEKAKKWLSDGVEPN